MKTKREHRVGNAVHRSAGRSSERGNALVYILIAIALFAALSFTLSRTTETEEAGELDEERAQFYATQMIGYATTAKSVVDQMIFSGASIDELDFVLPGHVMFDQGSNINKVFHPQGGGLNQGVLNKGMVAEVETLVPQPGWYIGRFNNVDWTDTNAKEVILTAYQITKPICQNINRIATGSIAIPVLEDSIRETLIDNEFTGAVNIDLTTEDDGICPECANKATLCVQNRAKTAYAFYTILADQ